MEPVKRAPLQDLLFFCLHGEGEEEEPGVLRVTGLRWQKAQPDGDGRAQIYMLPNEVHITLLPLWPSFIYLLIYLFVYLFSQPQQRLSARPRRTLVNGQHVIGVMERRRNHACTLHTRNPANHGRATCVKQHACCSVIHQQCSATATRAGRAVMLGFFPSFFGKKVLSD